MALLEHSVSPSSPDKCLLLPQKRAFASMIAISVLCQSPTFREPPAVANSRSIHESNSQVHADFTG
jgi:hypothetical protein